MISCADIYTAGLPYIILYITYDRGNSRYLLTTIQNKVALST